MLNFMLALIFLFSMSAANAASFYHFADCTTIMDGQPMKLRLYEERLEDTNAPRKGLMVVENSLATRLAKTALYIFGVNLTQNRMEINPEPGARSLKIYTSLDPHQLFVWVDIPVTPSLVEVEMRTPSGMIWGTFQCINIPHDQQACRRFLRQ